jgi:hypothetical protein
MTADRAERIRRRLRDPDVATWPRLSDEQIRHVAALLPPVPPGGDAGQRERARPRMITLPQRARLWAGLHRLGLTPRGEALATVSRWVGREIRASCDLTAGEASTALDAIGDGDHDAA